MLDWVNYQKELMGRIGELGALTPDTLKGYQALSAAGAKTAHLDAKTRELIALAVAVTTRATAASRCIRRRRSSTAPPARKSARRWAWRWL